jgi:F420H(2)-dependent quinone reductase
VVWPFAPVGPIVPRVPSRFLLTNRVANPVVGTLLRSPAGRGLGRHLAVLRYRGRRSGLTHDVVVLYGVDGSTVWINVGWPEHKKWWRNLREPSPVELWLAGRHHGATAVAVLGQADPHRAAAGLAVYRAAMGRLAVAPGDLTRAVLVRADIGAAED